MIDITKLTDADIGRWVIYKYGFGDQERGKLKSWNDKYIFVVYNCAGEWHRFQDFTGASTKPEDLIFEDEICDHQVVEFGRCVACGEVVE